MNEWLPTWVLWICVPKTLRDGVLAIMPESWCGPVVSMLDRPSPHNNFSKYINNKFGWKIIFSQLSKMTSLEKPVNLYNVFSGSFAYCWFIVLIKLFSTDQKFVHGQHSREECPRAGLACTHWQKCTATTMAATSGHVKETVEAHWWLQKITGHILYWGFW